MERNGPEIKSIPGWGTSWYARGPTYWLRRIGVSLVMLILVAMFGAMVGVFLAPGFQLRVGPAPGFVALGIVTVTTIVGFVWMWRRTPDARSSEKETKQAYVFILAWRGLGWIVLILIVVGAVAGGVARRSISAAVGTLVVLAFFGISVWMLGPMLALFVKSFTEEPRPVRLARQEVDDWYHERGLDSRGPIRPT
jgi:hypothetical protein